MTDNEKQIAVADHLPVDDDGADRLSLPVVEVLTGRGFVTGKSGSGKSNTASVVIENLLDQGFPVLIVDIDGEYYGLKEQYEILHAGGDAECDIQVGPEHAERLATLALEEGVPIILDVSSYLDEDTAGKLLLEVSRQLFAKEKKLKQPFLMVVEEIHEYIPQSGGVDECGQMLIKIGKRGRKHGLGLVGISQRPADVKKDFITQCDWLVWHRLTWNNDTKVVRRVIDADHADAIEELDDGEAFVQRDWAEFDVDHVQFDRKETFDAGATPGLEDLDRPDLKSLDDDLLAELDEISAEQDRRQDRIAELERKLAEREQEIEDLRDELARAEDMSDMAEKFTNAMLQQSEDADSPVQQTIEAEVMEVRQQKREAEQRVEDLEARLDEKDERIAELEAEVERLERLEDRVAYAEEIEAKWDTVQSWLAEAPDVIDAAPDAGDGTVDERVADLREELAAKEERIEELEAAANDTAADEITDLLNHEAVQTAIEQAKQGCDRAGEHFAPVLTVLSQADEAKPVKDVAAPLDPSESTVRGVLKALHTSRVVDKKGSRPTKYRLDREWLQQRVEMHEQQAQLSA